MGIIKPDDNYAYISNQDMTQAITNQNNVFIGKINPIIKRLIESIINK